jgi:hypothetical protein
MDKQDLKKKHLTEKEILQQKQDDEEFSIYGNEEMEIGIQAKQS